MLVYHRFLGRPVSEHTEILIIGTFNPETPENKADFFYGRVQNHLWNLLPAAFGEPFLKNSSKEEKIRFITQRKIGFIDLISSVNVDKPDDYRDDYIDGQVVEWTDVIGQMQQLHNLKKVCVTRKTFSGIPNIRKRILEVEEYCKQNTIYFRYLVTPSRGYTHLKQQEWDNFFQSKLFRQF